jgi:hypothetical protein
MGAWLRWLLIGSALLSVVALLWPEGVTQSVAHSEFALAHANTVVDAAKPQSASARPEAIQANSLPERLPALTLDPADFDPFVGAQPPPSPAPKPVFAPALPPPPATAAAPAAPPLPYRYLGQMLDPTGKRFVYLSRSDSMEVLVSVGTRLDEGYLVEAIGADGIQLHYPPLGTRAVIHIPPSSDAAAP